MLLHVLALASLAVAHLEDANEPIAAALCLDDAECEKSNLACSLAAIQLRINDKTTRYNSNYTEGYVFEPRLKSRAKANQTKITMGGGRRLPSYPSLSSRWLWPWISFWALRCTPLCSCCCILAQGPGIGAKGADAWRVWGGRAPATF